MQRQSTCRASLSPAQVAMEDVRRGLLRDDARLVANVLSQGLVQADGDLPCGQGLLQFAVAVEALQSIPVLLAKGARVDRRDLRGLTALDLVVAGTDSRLPSLLAAPHLPAVRSGSPSEHVGEGSTPRGVLLVVVPVLVFLGNLMMLAACIAAAIACADHGNACKPSAWEQALANALVFPLGWLLWGSPLVLPFILVNAALWAAAAFALLRAWTRWRPWRENP